VQKAPRHDQISRPKSLACLDFFAIHHLVLCEKGGEKITVPVIMGKRYTFEGLESLVNEHLNADGQVALLYYNNGRVTWRVFPKVKPPTNSKISAGMVNFLRPSKIELSAGLKELLKPSSCSRARRYNNRAAHSQVFYQFYLQSR